MNLKYNHPYFLPFLLRIFSSLVPSTLFESFRVRRRRVYSFYCISNMVLLEKVCFRKKKYSFIFTRSTYLVFHQDTGRFLFSFRKNDFFNYSCLRIRQYIRCLFVFLFSFEEGPTLCDEIKCTIWYK